MILQCLNKDIDNQGIKVITKLPICVFSKDLTSYSSCEDLLYHDQLDIDNIDDSYELDIVEYNERYDVYIPIDHCCTLYKTSNPNYHCTLVYKNIKCDICFEDEPIDNYFDVINE